MGLTLHWELRLPAHTTPSAVAHTLDALRECALIQPFVRVSPLGSALSVGDEAMGVYEALQHVASIAWTAQDDDTPALTGDPSSAVGFLVDPGEGCETTFFALVQRLHLNGTPADWCWRGFCKTQYASVVSDAHFLACHLTLINLLDDAIHLGFTVIVHDEGHYWETRDSARLLSEVGSMNKLVARLAGKFSDAADNSETALQAPIFEHPRFERLEMGVDD